MKKKKKILWVWVLVLLVGILLCNIYQNKHITVTEYEISDAGIPAAFDGFKIVQLTDVHSLQDEEMREQIIAETAKCEPDLIAITGDLVDSTVYSTQNQEFATRQRQEMAGEEMLTLVKQLMEVAPVLFVYGNHEMILLDNPEKNPFKTTLEELGVTFMNNRVIRLEKDGESITVMGVQDPATLYKDKIFSHAGRNTEEKMHAMLKAVTEEVREETYNILLSHRPETFQVYQQYPVDLVLTGHAHGGQFRIPFLGGLYAPGQGYFPKYTSGLYEENGCRMIVGRGIGNSVIPFRIFNQPQIVSVVLRGKSTTEK